MNFERKTGKLFIVSNRLPVRIQKDNGNFTFKQSVGGLATGLTNLFKKIHGYWIGWPGLASVPPTKRKDIAETLQKEYNCIPVFLNKEEIEKYYNGFSNSTIWPLFHYQSMFTSYDEKNWQEYIEVNKKFARKVLEYANEDDIIWVHDYHLLLLPGLLRKALPEAKIGFFLHIPFPSQELFRLLPWRREILEGMLGADLIGFHTYDYTRHFLSCCLRLANYSNEFGRISIENRFVWADTFPMGIDVKKFFGFSADKVKKIDFARNLPQKKIIISVDRMDITKGIPERLRAFERFLEKYPQWRKKIIYILIASPSRTHILNYQKLKKNVDELVGKINGRFSTLNWTPIHYIYKSVSQEELICLYRKSHLALITPLRDGMNLVAKEYIASRRDYKGVLILSEGAGACNELVEAIIVNPNDVERIADAINEGLEMPEKEQKERNKKMITRLRRYDIFRWGEDFVETLISKSNERKNTSNIQLNRDIFKEIVKKYRRSNRRVIFLDYDGTLVANYKDPSKFHSVKSVMELLDKLSSIEKNRIVLVSRSHRRYLKKWFSDCKNLDMIAEHGLWIFSHNKNRWHILEKNVDTEWKEHIRPLLEAFVDRTPGSFIEEKPHSLSWDYRKCNPSQAEIRLRELMTNLLSIVAGKPLEVLRGDKLVGVKLNTISKGKAALRILEEEDKVDFLMAVGDDWTDEEMFTALPEECISIRVGRATDSCAKYYVDSQKDVITLLNSFL